MLHRAAIVAVIALSSGCVVLSADVPQVCTTQTVQVQGDAPVGAAPTSPAPETTINQDLTLPTALPDLVTHLSISGGTISVSQGDLSFIDSITLTLVPPTSAEQPLSLLAYTRSGSVPAFINIPETSTELAPYLGSAGAQVQVSITGRPPTTGTDLAIELCVDAGLNKTISLSGG